MDKTVATPLLMSKKTGNLNQLETDQIVCFWFFGGLILVLHAIPGGAHKDVIYMSVSIF